jgi:hypothetical protein
MNDMEIDPRNRKKVFLSQRRETCLTNQNTSYYVVFLTENVKQDIETNSTTHFALYSWRIPSSGF